MTEREHNWRSIREIAGNHAAPDHLSDTHLRQIAAMLCAGVAPFTEDQAAMGPLPSYVAIGECD